MSGLVAIRSADPAVVARGPAALELLRHTDAYERLDIAGDGLWIGVCGRPSTISVATQTGVSGDARTLLAGLAGEISNSAAVERELGLAGEAGAAELVLAAYRRWGGDLFAHLEGVFTLAVADPAAGLLLTGPDPYGVAYLHVVTFGGDVLVASEAKAFLVDPRFKVTLDGVSAASLVALGHEFGRGLFADVQAAPQGHHFEIDDAVHTVRHWQPNDALGTLTGKAYVTRLRETVEELAAEAYDEGVPLLPLTGGLDSRLLAAARPRHAGFRAFTFGTAADSDCRRAAQIAAVCGMTHQAIAFQPDYVARHGEPVTWLTEGRLTPAENTTGFQMGDLARDGCDWFVSGVDCGLGRRFSKAKTAFPDWNLVGPDNQAFQDWLMLRFSRSGMSPEEARLAFGPRAGQMRDPGIDALTEYINGTRGLCGVDRLDLYFVGGRARGWRCSGLDVADVWVTPRAPFFNRRWIEAVLAGAPAERLDDQPRLRLISELDPAVARVPWVMTLMPLRPSRRVLQGLSAVSRLRRAQPPGRAGDASATAASSARRTAFTKRYMATVKGAYHRIYTYGDHRDEWLRTASRPFIERILLSDRCADHGLVDPRGIRTLVEEHMAGKDHTLALSLVLGIELWQRQFVDGERPAAGLPRSPAA